MHAETKSPSSAPMSSDINLSKDGDNRKLDNTKTVPEDDNLFRMPVM
jgi:hypothetical protein